MRKSNMLRMVIPPLLFATLAVACATGPGSGDRVGVGKPLDIGAPIHREVATGTEPQACHSHCNCPLGQYCNVEPGQASGACTYPAPRFSPAPPNPCYETCQCPAAQVCKNAGPYGSCRPQPEHCSSDSDCGHHFVCSYGACGPGFGPSP